MECEFCNKTFSGKSTLIKHQRSVKKCLEIQEQRGLVIKRLIYTCTVCNKDFTSNNGLKYHNKSCKQKKELDHKTNIDLHDTVLQLKKELEELKSRANTINNHHTTNNHNTTNNVSIINYMTKERVLEIFKEHFEVKDLNQKRYGLFTVKHILNSEGKPLYKCTDLSRKKCVYIDTSGNEVQDTNMATLINLLYQAHPYVKELVQDEIIDQTDDVILEIRNDYRSYLSLDTDGAEFKSIVARCSIPKQNLVDDIDWNINKKEEIQETMNNKVFVSDINEDFFTQE